MNRKYNLVIFDLDGTLLDTSKGIFNSVRYAENQMGFTKINDELLKRFVGPPPKLMYMKQYGIDEETALKAAKKHREYGRTKAVFEAEVYEGMEDVLNKLKSNGYKLAVATLKSQAIAETVLENFGLEKYFDCIVGMDVNETLTKSMTIKLAMQNTEICDKAVMIGDSPYDYEGALEANVDFIGVTYGFGFEDKEASNYEFDVAKTSRDILDLV